jgi:predicted small metal-binding protein
VSCRDFVVDYDFRGTGETEEELIYNLVDHAINNHGYPREYVIVCNAGKDKSHNYKILKI